MFCRKPSSLGTLSIELLVRSRQLRSGRERRRGMLMDWIRLSVATSVVSLGRLARTVGISVNAFIDSTASCRLINRLIESGSDERELLRTSSVTRHEKPPMKAGRTDSLLKDTFNTFRLLANMLSSVGTTLSAFLLRSTVAMAIKTRRTERKGRDEDHQRGREKRWRRRREEERNYKMKFTHHCI